MKINQKSPKKVGWLTFYSEEICEIYCCFNFDIICIDLEHSYIGLPEVAKLSRIISLYNKKIFIRISNKNSEDLNKYLDIGIDGIIVPDISNVNDCNQIINKIYYPPKGNRGVGLHRANKYGYDFNDYFNKKSKKLEFFGIIESKEAVENLDDILSLSNLSGIMIGPYDLSTSLGIPGKFESVRFKNIVKIIESKCSNYKKQIGIHVVQPDNKLINYYKKKKYSFIVYSLDTVLIKNAIKELIK